MSRCPYCSFDPTNLNDFCNEHRPKVRETPAPPQKDAAESPAQQEVATSLPIEHDRLLSAIAGSVKSAIDAHGPITRELSHSAAKRILSQLRAREFSLLPSSSCGHEIDQAESPAPQGWQPIETAPKDGTPFIAASTMDAFRAFYDTEQEVWVCEDDGLWFGALSHPPTHWMNLPGSNTDGKTFARGGTLEMCESRELPHRNSGDA